jgi:hypothetical protein
MENSAVTDPEVLETLYWHEGLSMWRIAERLDCSETTVYRNMRKYGIDRRGTGYNSTSGKDVRNDNPIYLRTRVDGYEQIQHTYRGENYRCYHHQLLMVAMGEDPHKVFSEEYDCHHKNEIKWDNRSENLELMTKEEHMRHHAEKNDLGSEAIQYSEEEMLSWINAYVEEFGYVPTQSDIDGWPGPTPEAYQYRFPSWKYAINAAGWEVPNHPTDKNGRRIGYEGPKRFEGELGGSE